MFNILNYNWLQNKDDSNNIFRNKDLECSRLNKKSTHSNYYSKDQKGNICKYINKDDILKWELNVYMTFIQNNLFPLVNSTQSHMIYYTSNLISLRTFLYKSENIINITYILNELFSYVHSFRLYGFIHGNLNIDNVFIYPHQSKLKNYQFYVIDYTNSYICVSDNDIWHTPKYKRISYLGNNCISRDLTKLINWDFITLYISLKILFKDNIENMRILDKIISNYINIEDIHKLLKKVINNKM